MSIYSFVHVHVLANIDGLPIPFFDLGMNVSRTMSHSATLTSKRVYPEWWLWICRNPENPNFPAEEAVERVK